MTFFALGIEYKINSIILKSILFYRLDAANQNYCQKNKFPTLKPRVSVKNAVLGMVKGDLDALAPCASKSSEPFYARINFSEKKFD